MSVWMVWSSVWMAFEVEEHTWQPCRRSLANGGRVGRQKKSWNMATPQWMSNFLATALAAKHRRGVAWSTDVVDIHSEHTRSTLQPDEAFPDLKCQTRCGCITLEVGRNRNRKRKSNGKWKRENRKELLAFYWSSAINRRIILMNWWLPSGPSQFQCTALVSVLIVFQNVSHWFSLSIFVFAFVFCFFFRFSFRILFYFQHFRNVFKDAMRGEARYPCSALLLLLLSLSSASPGRNVVKLIKWFMRLEVARLLNYQIVWHAENVLGIISPPRCERCARCEWCSPGWRSGGCYKIGL